jgi:hypothetical protein
MQLWKGYGEILKVEREGKAGLHPRQTVISGPDLAGDCRRPELEVSSG